MKFNGVDFSQWMRCGATRRMAPPMENVTVESGSGIGETFARRKLKPLVISTFCRLALGRDVDPCRVAAERRRIASLLVTDSPAALVLDDEPDKHYMAMASNLDELSSLGPSGSFRLEFTAYDPIAYGKRVRRDVGASQVVLVDGTYETYPTFELVARSSPRPRVTHVGSGGHVELGQVAHGGATVVVDMGAESATVNGNPCPVTLDSDFFALEPGLNEILVTGAEGVMTWTERWL